MSEKIKVAIIGCGSIMRNCHITSYYNIDHAEIVAFCDIIKEKAEKYAKEYAERKQLDALPAVYTDYKEVLEIEGLDAVEICTPNYLHSIIAVDALNKGINVLCEKPDAVSVAEAEKMKAAAEKNGKTLMVIRNNRFRPVAQYAKKFIESGQAGEIYATRCGWQRRRGGPPHGSWFTDMSQSGGGPLIDLGVHMIDLTMYLMGNPTPVSVSGCTYNKFGNDGSAHGKLPAGKEAIHNVEDLAMAFIRFDNGACMQVEVSWASNVEGEDVFFELRGTKAGISNNRATDGKIKIFTESEDGSVADILPNINDSEHPGAHERNIRHFLDVIKGKAEPMFTPEQGLNMIKILEAIYKSAEVGEEIKL